MIAPRFPVFGNLRGELIKEKAIIRRRYSGLGRNRGRLAPHSSAYSRFFEGRKGVFEAFEE